MNGELENPNPVIALLPAEIARDLFLQIHRTKYRTAGEVYFGSSQEFQGLVLDEKTEALYRDLCGYFSKAAHFVQLQSEA